MKIAAIDVGTNSFHIIVTEISEDGSYEIIERAKEMVRLGDKTLVDGVIPPDAFHRGAEALRNFRRIVDRHRCEEVIANATSAVREAENGGAFVRTMRDESGIELRVIRGDEEARLIYLGARQKLDFRGRRGLLADIGGGSVELIVADAKDLYLSSSFKLGVLRLVQTMITTDPISSEERARLIEQLHLVLATFVSRARSIGFDFFALSSGTAHTLTSLASVRETGQPPSLIHGTRLSFASLYALERELSSMPRERRALLEGLDPKRIDTIVPGAILVRTLFETLAVDEAIICETALREGMIIDYIARNRGTIHLVEEFPNLRRRSVMQLARRCGYPKVHSHHVVRLALSLFRQTRDLHGLSNSDSQVLEYAAVLHDIGYLVSRNQHHKHSHYLVLNCLKAGFEGEEVRILANLVRYHRKATPRKNHESFLLLSKSAQKKVQALAALLRIADGLDRGHTSLVEQIRVSLGEKVVTIEVFSREDPELELWGARRKADLFEEFFGQKIRFVPKPAEEVQDLL